MTVDRGIGGPDGIGAWNALEADTLSAAFDRLNARMALLDREARKWLREAKSVKNRATQQGVMQRLQSVGQH